MSNLLLDTLGTVGTVLDTPRSMAWALATGRDPLEAMLHPEKRLTGWDLMKELGVKNKPGFDATDVLAVGSEMLLDPLNLLFGAGLLKGGGKAAKAAKASNALRAKRLATGGMPEEVAKLTKAVEPPLLKQGASRLVEEPTLEYAQFAKTEPFRNAVTGKPFEATAYRTARKRGAEWPTSPHYGEDEAFVQSLYGKRGGGVVKEGVKLSRPFVVDAHVPQAALLERIGTPAAKALLEKPTLDFKLADEIIEKHLAPLGYDGAVYLGDPMQGGAEVVKFVKHPVAAAVSTTPKPKRLYHGTSHAYAGKPDFGRLNPDDWVHGYFTTENPKVASGYSKGTGGGIPKNYVPNAEMEQVEQATMAKLRDSGTFERWRKLVAAGGDDLTFEPTDSIRHAFREAQYTGDVGPVVRELESIEMHEGLDFSKELDILTEPYNPNVRMQYLDVRKPFDLEKEYRWSELKEGKTKAKLQHPLEAVKYDDPVEEAMEKWVEPPPIGSSKQVTGQEIVDELGWARGPNEPTKAAAVTAGLRDLGFDSLTHRGGLGGGRTQHQVHVAFGPEQIYSPWIAPELRPVPKASKAVLAALLSPSLGARLHGLGPNRQPSTYPWPGMAGAALNRAQRQ